MINEVDVVHLISILQTLTSRNSRLINCFIFLAADHNKNSLNHVTSQVIGEDGVNGRNKHMHGKNAPHLYVPVTFPMLFCCVSYQFQGGAG